MDTTDTIPAFIPLSKGKFAVVDSKNLDKLNRYKWHAKLSHGGWYAVNNSGPDNIWMHRFIMDAKPDEDVDHKNHDTLNNLESNLRVCSRSQNNANSRKRSNTSSRFKGVSWNRANRKWTAHIRTNYVLTYLGSFDIEEEAALAYNEAALKRFGEFAKVNEL